jgi:hypothetical protein
MGRTKKDMGLNVENGTYLKGFLNVEGYGCDFGKDRGLFAKWWRPCVFDRGGLDLRR